MIIDAKDMILGRLCTFAAKQGLQGNQVDIVNAEQVVITGSRENVLAKYFHRLTERGTPRWGPFFYKKENLFVKRVIRGMLPYKQPKGKKAVKLIKCHIGIPVEFAGKKFETLKFADIANSKATKFITVQEVCKMMGRR